VVAVSFVIFLDATHFGYSLPPDADIKFTPHLEGIPYISSVFAKKGIEGIKNRYHNTIFALDQLFKDLFDTLKSQALFDKACIMVTADHGEEFFEKGQLFHASHLSNEQLKIPFIFKAPSFYKKTIDQDGLLSHITMFDLVTKVMTNQSFQGRAWQVSSRFNFSLSPEEHVIVTKNGKALFTWEEGSSVMKFRGFFDEHDRATQKILSLPVNLEIAE
jgi:membrane-anchored protein YejM (alkaline phosphatase superfamily)